MSNTAPVVTEVETILSDIAPIVPKLAQKIPSKVRAGLYVLAPIAVSVFDVIATGHLSTSAIAITDAVASFVVSFVAVGNTPKA